MASMNWLGFSLSSQELPSQPANQDHSRLGFNSDEITGTDVSGECGFYLTSDSTAHSLNLPPSFDIFEAFNRSNNHAQDWDLKGLGSNTENYKTTTYLPVLNLDNNQKEPKLENFLGRHSYGDDDHAAYGNASSGDYIFPNCSLQVPAGQAAETSTGGGTSSTSSIGLSMIKTWLRNQPTQSDNNESGGNAATSGNNAQTLSLSMSTGSQSSSPLPLLTPNAGSSDNKQLKTSPALDTQNGAIESMPRKSIDTFGQRTSIYRGVTRHRWTGRYEAHLWDNSCRREGQTRKGRQVYLGGYDKEEKAARAYDLAALKYWGTTTTTNFPISNYDKELEEMKHMTRQEHVASLRRKSSGFSRGASIYRGVTRHHQHGRWQARIGRVAGNKDLYLGTFSTQEEAAEAYDIAAIKFRGLNAVTNFDMSRYDVKSILESSTLPIGGAAKRLKDVEHAEVSVDCQIRTDEHSMNSQLTEGINNYGWPNLAFQQPQPYSLHYPYGQRLWCKQEQDSDSSHNFLHSNSGLHYSIMSMDNTSASINDANGGYVIPMGTVIANENQRSCNNGLGDSGYETVFGSTTDPYDHHARNLYYISQPQQSSADHAVTNTWAPTAIPTLASRSLCPGAPPFTLLHE